MGYVILKQINLPEGESLQPGEIVEDIASPLLPAQLRQKFLCLVPEGREEEISELVKAGVNRAVIFKRLPRECQPRPAARAVLAKRVSEDQKKRKPKPEPKEAKEPKEPKKSKKEKKEEAPKIDLQKETERFLEENKELMMDLASGPEDE